MTFKRNSPGCNASGSCGCGSCAIATDDFNRSDGTDVTTGSSCGWTETFGSAWSIASNKLSCDTAGRLLCNTTHPDALSTTHIEVDVSRTSNGTASIILAHVDSGTYYEAKFTIGTGSKIEIRQFNATVETLLETESVTINTSTTYTIAACISANGYCTAYLNGSMIVSGTGMTPTGDDFGLKAQAGTLYDNFTATKVAEGCETCDEPVCDSPATMEAVLTSDPFDNKPDHASGPCDDGQCAQFGGTFVLPYYGSLGAGLRTYQDSFGALCAADPACCTDCEVTWGVLLTCDTFGNYSIQARAYWQDTADVFNGTLPFFADYELTGIDIVVTEFDYELTLTADYEAYDLCPCLESSYPATITVRFTPA